MKYIPADIKTVYILVGPKGAGKSYIGSLIEQQYNIPFIRLEDWALRIKNNRALDNETYLREASYIVEKGIIQAMKTHNELIHETTGLSHYYDLLLGRLKTKYAVTVIGIKAGTEICSRRILEREFGKPLTFSPGELDRINVAVAAKDYKVDFEILNENKNEQQLKEELREIFEI